MRTLTARRPGSSWPTWAPPAAPPCAGPAGDREGTVSGPVLPVTPLSAPCTLVTSPVGSTTTIPASSSAPSTVVSFTQWLKAPRASRPSPSQCSQYRGELSQVVEGAQGVELLQRQHQRLVGWRVQEVEVDEVVDAWGQGHHPLSPQGRPRALLVPQGVPHSPKCPQCHPGPELCPCPKMS